VVRVVGDGRAALDALEQETFDLLLMDVPMPVMDGLEATAAIREREKDGDRHIPIIAMTAHSLKGRPGALHARRNGRIRFEANPYSGFVRGY
jgi:CheY-like chemotaxis protein